jgi:protein MpaA
VIKAFLARKRKSLGIALVLLGLGYATAMHVDWWLYHFYSGQAARDLAPLQSRIKATSLHVETVGSVSYQGAAWPLQAVALVRPAAREVCVLAGVHGNEPAGVEAVMTLVEDLARNPKLYPQFSFIVVPLANPWGWAHDLRHNGDNLDVARNFTEGGTRESALIKQLLQRHRCSILVDLHEDRIHSGFYMLTYENARAQVAKKIAQEVQASGVPLYSRPPDGVYHIREAEFASVSRSTLALYARQHGIPQTYIVETPTRLPFPERVKLHRLALDRLLQANIQ